MRLAKRALALLAGVLLLLPVPFVSARGAALTALGIALAVLAQLRRRRPLRKRVVLTGAVLGAAVATAVGLGPTMMSPKLRRTPEQEARARAEAIKVLPPGLRGVVAAQPQMQLSPGAQRAMGVVGAVIGIEVLAMLIGAYVAGGVCLCLYGAFGQGWRRGAVGGAAPESVVAPAE